MKNTTLARLLFTISSVLLPAFAFADSGGQLGTDISGLITFFDNYLVPLIFGLALLLFLWGVFQYFIAGGGNEEKREQGRTFVIYGIIGLVVMLSVWGIVNLITGSLGFDSTTRPTLPTFNSTSDSSSDDFSNI